MFDLAGKRRDSSTIKLIESALFYFADLRISDESCCYTPVMPAGFGKSKSQGLYSIKA